RVAKRAKKAVMACSGRDKGVRANRFIPSGHVFFPPWVAGEARPECAARTCCAYFPKELHVPPPRFLPTAAVTEDRLGLSAIRAKAQAVKSSRDAEESAFHVHRRIEWMPERDAESGALLQHGHLFRRSGQRVGRLGRQTGLAVEIADAPASKFACGG